MDYLRWFFLSNYPPDWTLCRFLLTILDCFSYYFILTLAILKTLMKKANSQSINPFSVYLRLTWLDQWIWLLFDYQVINFINIEIQLLRASPKAVQNGKLSTWEEITSVCNSLTISLRPSWSIKVWNYQATFPFPVFLFIWLLATARLNAVADEWRLLTF